MTLLQLVGDDLSNAQNYSRHLPLDQQDTFPTAERQLDYISSGCWIKSGTHNKQAKSSDHLMMIPFELNLSASLGTHLQKTIPKSTADLNVIILSARMLSLSWNLGAGSPRYSCQRAYAHSKNQLVLPSTNVVSGKSDLIQITILRSFEICSLLGRKCRSFLIAFCKNEFLISTSPRSHYYNKIGWRSNKLMVTTIKKAWPTHSNTCALHGHSYYSDSSLLLCQKGLGSLWGS